MKFWHIKCELQYLRLHRQCLMNDLECMIWSQIIVCEIYQYQQKFRNSTDVQILDLSAIHDTHLIFRFIYNYTNLKYGGQSHLIYRHPFLANNESRWAMSFIIFVCPWVPLNLPGNDKWISPVPSLVWLFPLGHIAQERGRYVYTGLAFHQNLHVVVVVNPLSLALYKTRPNLDAGLL